jgi:hypothetical protein
MFHFFCEEEQKCIPFLSNMSAPTATTTPQTTNTATTPPLGANGELSLELLQEFAALLRNHRGAKVAITYRLRSHSYFVEAGEWQDDIGDVGEFDALFAGKSCLLLAKLQDDLERETWVEFPNPDVEYSKLKIMPKGGITSIKTAKRPREPTQPLEPQNTPSPFTPQDLAAMAARATHQILIEGKAKKALLEVVQGDGLRIPLNWPKALIATNIPLWYQRRLTEDPAALAAEWTDSWEKLCVHYAAHFRTTAHRVAYQAAVHHCVSQMWNPSTPVSKEGWALAFAPCSAALGEVITVSQSQALGSKAVKKLWIAFEENLLDIEEVLRGCEGDEPTAVVPALAGPGPDASSLKIAKLEAELAVARNQARSDGRGTGNSFRSDGDRHRGRGRGKW